MERLERMRKHVFLLICLLGLVYVGVTLLGTEDYISDVVADSLKLALVAILCAVGFFSGREYFHFTHTTPVFLAAMCCVVLFHITELTEEFVLFQSVPLLGETKKRAG
ncbi:hypothetical protein KQH65_12610 [archaeon]|nr:hypothetical protein [archaeon]